MSLLGIKKIDANPVQIQLQFIPNPPLDPLRIIQLVQSEKQIQLNGPDRIKYLPKKENDFEKLEQRIEAIRMVMKRLSSALVQSTPPTKPTAVLS